MLATLRKALLLLIIPLLLATALPVNATIDNQVIDDNNRILSPGDEVISKRTRNSKTHWLGGDKYSYDGTTGSIHYQEDEEWKEIDNSFDIAYAPWNWEMTKAGYQIRVKNDFTAGQIIEFEAQDETVQFQPMALEWTNDLDQIQQVSMPQSVAPLITNPIVDLLPAVGMQNHEGTIRWDDAYGSGIDFEWKCTPTRLAKILEINDFSNLPAPQQYIVDGGNPVLRLNLIFDPPDRSNVDIVVDGQVWNQQDKVQTFNTIEFKKGNETLWGFMPLKHWDSGEDEGQSIATLEKRGNKLYISIRVSYNWLQTAVFPVFIDVDVDDQVSASNDDGEAQGGGGYSATSTYTRVGYWSTQTYDGWHRFTGITIAQGSTIDVAYMELYEQGSTGNPLTKIWADDQNNPGHPTNNADYYARTTTTAGVDEDGDPGGNGWHQTDSIVSVIQELVTSYDYSNEAILILHKDDTGSGTVLRSSRSYNYSGNIYGAKIHIEYTAAGPDPPTVTTQAASSIEDTTATGNGNITDTGGENADLRGVVWDDATHGDPGDTAPNLTDYVTAGGGFTSEAGSFGTGAFTASMTGLPTGTTIYYRAWAHNSGGYSYGAEVTFLTKPAAPTNVAATDGVHTDKVVITWTKSTGATDYHVWRDAVDLGAAGDVATFDDSGADAPTITPGTTDASDGTSALHVVLIVNGESTSNGTTHTYKVVASNATGNSDDSLTDTGYRGVGALTYQWQRSAADSDAGYGNIAGATTDPYNDTAAPAPTITPGTTDASDGTSSLHVVLIVVGETVNNGAGRYYRCVLNATGATQQISTSDRGYRGTAAITYQWQRSAADADAGYGNIGGATTDPYNDTAAPAPSITAGAADASDGTSSLHTVLSTNSVGNNGDGRWYQCLLDSTGAAQQTSASNRGYRGTTTLTYQWLRSVEDADAAFGNLSGATTSPYNDTTGAIDPDGRWYYAEVSMSGAASPQDTTHDRGYREAGVVGGGVIPIFLPIGLVALTLFLWQWQKRRKEEQTA